MINYYDIDGSPYKPSHIAPSYFLASDDPKYKDGWYYLDECQQVSNRFDTFEEARYDLLMYIDYCLNGTGNDKLFYYKDDLFNQKIQPPYVLAHACNCKGVWGSGVAKTFHEKFPKAYEVYKDYCTKNGSNSLGRCLLIDNDNISIACLFTSDGYGQYVDSPEKILHHTDLAIKDLFRQTSKIINMPKINSGLFKVPWEDTEKVIRKNKPMSTIVNVYYQ